MPDSIDALLRDEEERLKEKRARLRAFAASVAGVRDAIRASQDSAKAVVHHDGLSRSEMRDLFGLTPSEATLLLPRRPRESQPRAASGNSPTH
jgi:hypothetical protein